MSNVSATQFLGEFQVVRVGPFDVTSGWQAGWRPDGTRKFEAFISSPLNARWAVETETWWEAIRLAIEATDMILGCVFVGRDGMGLADQPTHYSGEADHG